jgi:hypothetical protein
VEERILVGVCAGLQHHSGEVDTVGPYLTPILHVVWVVEVLGCAKTPSW